MTLLEQLLARGVDDWVSAAELLDVAASAGSAESGDHLTVALGLVTQAILGGFVDPGDVSEAGFDPWPLERAESVERIVSEWSRRADGAIAPGEIVWLRNTPRGERVGELVLNGGELP